MLKVLNQCQDFMYIFQKIETATKVGLRHGELAIIVIDAQKMYKDGYKFYLSANGVWLTEKVPVEYFKELLSGNSL